MLRLVKWRSLIIGESICGSNSMCDFVDELVAATSLAPSTVPSAISKLSPSPTTPTGSQ